MRIMRPLLSAAACALLLPVLAASQESEIDVEFETYHVVAQGQRILRDVELRNVVLESRI